MNARFRSGHLRLFSAALGAVLAFPASDGFAADMPLYPVKAPPAPVLYDLNGYFFGGNLGYAAGRSNFTANAIVGNTPPVTGSLNLYRPPDNFAESGSFFEGFQIGYNRMLPNRVVLGWEADMSFPNFPDINGLGIGNVVNFNSPVLGAVSFSENVRAMGTVRGRIGYSPGNFLLYATGGLAWTRNQQALTLPDGSAAMPFLWRFGWTAGLGVEAPILPNWTAKAEYLFTDYGNSSVVYENLNHRFN